MTMDFNGNGNRNGVFMKLAMGVLASGIILSSAGIIKLYRDVGVLQSATDGRVEIERRFQELKKEIAEVRAESASINADRHQRTIVLQNILARLDLLERRGR